MKKCGYWLSVSLLMMQMGTVSANGTAEHMVPAYQFPPDNINLNTQQYYIPRYLPQQSLYPVPSFYTQQMMLYYPQYGYPLQQQSPQQHLPGPTIPYAYTNPQVPQPQNRVPRFKYASPYNPNRPATPGPKLPLPAKPKQSVKPWGDTRHIWPDFYTDFTGDFWDEMINTPSQLGYMPGGWRFPSFSSPDPVTVGDAVANQVPPILDEGVNFINFADE